MKVALKPNGNFDFYFCFATQFCLEIEQSGDFLTSAFAVSTKFESTLDFFELHFCSLALSKSSHVLYLLAIDRSSIASVLKAPFCDFMGFP